MALRVLGFDHQTIPGEARAACRLSPARVRSHLTHLAHLCATGPCVRRCQPAAACPAAVEVAVISNCNRLELYVVTAAEPDDDLLRAWFLGLLPRSHAGLATQLMLRRDAAAVEHLLRVASGLESMVLGEPNILEQLADAYELARRCGTAGPSLAQLFQHAVRVGKRARAEMDLSGRTAFLSRAAMHFFGQRHPELAAGNVLIVGAGKMAYLVAQALRYEHTQPIAVANRTPEHAEALARQVGGQTFPWHQIRTALVWADVVVTATAAHHPILDDNDIAAVLPQRQRRPLLLIDMALPHNIHPAATGMAGVSYYDLDDLQAVLADLAHAESAHAAALPRWIAAQPVVGQVVQSEAAALWARLGHDRPADVEPRSPSSESPATHPAAGAPELDD